MKTGLLPVIVLFLLGPAMPLQAANYLIDTKGAHASINFKIPHLGYSYMLGRFDDFAGSFRYDPDQPQSASVDVVIKTASINSNHAERDRHLRGQEFLAVEDYPEARFVSTRFETEDGQTGQLHGELTLRGVTKDVVINVEKVGEGDDPWGGYRVGFSGSTTLKLADFGISTDLGPASREVELILHVEGVRQ